jgi:hypothetical protein
MKMSACPRRFAKTGFGGGVREHGSDDHAGWSVEGRRKIRPNVTPCKGIAHTVCVPRDTPE